jgi:hypothetical protein
MNKTLSHTKRLTALFKILRDGIACGRIGFGFKECKKSNEARNYQEPMVGFFLVLVEMYVVLSPASIQLLVS